ncbi:hypothetical protein ACMZYR_26310, partial [Pseudomonas syringae pv. actinidiae]
YVSTSRLGGAASALSTAIPGRIAGGQMVAGLYDRFRYVTWSHSTPAAQATGEPPLDRQPSGSDRV